MGFFLGWWGNLLYGRRMGDIFKHVGDGRFLVLTHNGVKFIIGL